MEGPVLMRIGEEMRVRRVYLYGGSAAQGRLLIGAGQERYRYPSPSVTAVTEPWSFGSVGLLEKLKQLYVPLRMVNSRLSCCILHNQI